MPTYHPSSTAQHLKIEIESSRILEGLKNNGFELILDLITSEQRWK
jgi:hypothetical protein